MRLLVLFQSGKHGSLWKLRVGPPTESWASRAQAGVPAEGEAGRGPVPTCYHAPRGGMRPEAAPGLPQGTPPQGLGQTCISDGGSSRPRVQGCDGGTPQPPAPRPPAAPPEEGVLPLRAGARREALLQRLPPRCVCSLAAFCWEARHLIPKRAACGLIVQLSRAVKRHPRWPGGGVVCGRSKWSPGLLHLADRPYVVHSSVSDTHLALSLKE